MREIWNDLLWAIGIDRAFGELSVWQVILRTVVVYLTALVLIRIGKRRFMGDYSAIDILLGFVLGSVLARGVTGAISIFNMLVVVVMLLGLHWLFAALSFYWPWFERAIETSPRKLIENGKVIDEAVRKSKITNDELAQALREQGQVEDVTEVKTAYLERDGSITVIPKERD